MHMEKRRVIGIGEMVLDIVFKDGKPLAAVPGGSVFNSMVSLGRTAGKRYPEVPLLMISQIGNDEVSALMTGFMEENSLKTEAVRRFDGQSTVSIAMLDADNNARYEFYRDADTPPFEVPEMAFGPGDILLFGSTFAVSPDTGEATRALVTRAHEAGATVFYDINFRKNHRAQREALRKEIERNIALSDIVRGSQEDIETLYDLSDPETVYRTRIAPRCSTFICTRGADSAVVFSEGVCATFPTVPVEKVVSTIGAGDNFNAGIVYGLLRGGFTRNQARHLGTDDWPSLVETAMRFSAEVCGSLFNYVSTDFIQNL